MGIPKILSVHALAWYMAISICAQAVYGHSNNCMDTIRLPNVFNIGNKTYFVELHKKLNWYHANMACKRYNMELLAIDSDQEFDSLVVYISKMENNNRIWTSGTDLGTLNEYRWMSNGRIENLKKWHKGNPSSFNENCIEIQNDRNTILLNDNKCDVELGYICQSIIKTYCTKETYSEC